jgi:hypothetical protein
MAVFLSPVGGAAAQFFTNTGAVLTGGKLYTYAAGTTTPQATYTTSSGSTARTNPIILDAAGRVSGSGEIWLTDGVSYKFLLRDSNDVLIATYDNIDGINQTVNAENVVYDPPFNGATQTNVEAKLAQTISIKDFGALTTNSASQNATALLAAEATGANDIYVPPGTYNVTGSTVLTKRYNGPGSLAFSGLGAQTFVGAGLNDATYSGSYNGNRPLQIVIKINSMGTPDTLAYSFNGGVTFVTTQEVYNPVTDSYDVGPINIVAGAMQIFGTGVFVTFGATTGHTLNNSWSFTLTPNLQTVNTQGTTFSVQGAPFAAAFGVQNTQLGISSFGNLNSVGSGNTALGYETLYANTVGYANTAVGARSLRANTTGFFNHAIGNATLVHCTTGHENTAIGTYSLYDLTTSSANTAVGVDTQRYLSTGSENTALGVQALYQNVTGLQNVAVGLYALRGGSSSLSIGRSCSYNTATGTRAQFEGQGQFNSAFGHEAGYTITGNYNSSFGAGAGTRTTAGDYNVFVGYQAGANASQSLLASNSIAVGDGAYTTGDNAVAIGSNVSSPANIFTVCNSAHTFFRPSTDNVTAMGGPANRWTVVYAATGTINTSDERQKQQIKPIDSAALSAWAKVEYCQYKFNDAVEKKGAGARWHFGLVAQRVKEAFESEGLDAFEYGVLCYDEWEDEFVDVFVEKTRQVLIGTEVIEEKYFEPTGEKKLINAAGNRYGIRYEEALALECAYLRSQLSKG